MREKMNTTVSNITDMIANGQEDIIEAYVQTFSCKKASDDGTEKSLNPDIERFIKTNAIQFAKMQTAIYVFFITRGNLKYTIVLFVKSIYAGNASVYALPVFFLFVKSDIAFEGI